MDNVYLTKEGYKKLAEECEYLRSTKRKEILTALSAAREHGDLRENADYDVAKEAYALNEARVGTLSQKLAVARIINKDEIPQGKAYLGATIKILNRDTKDEYDYELVGTDEADPATGKISVSSPVGKGLVGHEEGDEFDITIPAGILKFKILKIS